MELERELKKGALKELKMVRKWGQQREPPTASEMEHTMVQLMAKRKAHLMAPVTQNRFKNQLKERLHFKKISIKN